MKIFNPSRLISIIFLIPSFSILWSQQSSVFNQGSYNLYSLNPAALGLTETTQANLNYKKNWIGFVGSPELTQISIDGPISAGKQGYGLTLKNERAGIFLNTSLSTAFRHRIRLTKNQQIYFGFSGGLQRQTADFSKINADAPDEFKNWPSIQTTTLPDASVGIVYGFKNFKFMFSGNHLFNQKFKYQEPVFNEIVSYRSLSNFNLVIQHNFQNKKGNWTYTPNLTLRSSLGLPIQFDILNTVSYSEKLFLGLGYRSHFAAYGNIGFSVNEKLRAFYSYEYSNGIQSTSMGGHEIGLSIRIQQSKNSKIKTDISIPSREEEKNSITKNSQTALVKNHDKLKTEFWDLLAKQIPNREVHKLLSNSEKQNNKIEDNAPRTKYIFIETKNISKKENNKIDANTYYEIIYGSYIEMNDAKKMQQFLGREFDTKSKIVQINGLEKNLFYVASQEQFQILNSAEELVTDKKTLLKNKFQNEISVDVWILQTQKTK